MKTITITYDLALNTFVAKNAFAIHESLKRDGWTFDPHSRHWLNRNPATAMNFRGLMDDSAKNKVDQSFELQAKRSPVARDAEDEYCCSEDLLGPLDEDVTYWPPEDDEEEPDFQCCNICGREIDDLESVDGVLPALNFRRNLASRNGGANWRRVVV